MLVIGIATRHSQAALRTAQFKIIARHFSNNTEARTGQRGLCRLRLRTGGLVGATHTTEKVEFITRIKARVIQLKVALCGRTTQSAVVALALCPTAGTGTEGGQVIKALRDQRSAGLTHTRLRLLDVLVGVQRGADQFIEQRLVKQLPPRLVDRIGFGIDQGARGKLCARRHRRRAEAGAHGAGA